MYMYIMYRCVCACVCVCVNACECVCVRVYTLCTGVCMVGEEDEGRRDKEGQRQASIALLNPIWRLKVTPNSPTSKAATLP